MMMVIHASVGFLHQQSNSDHSYGIDTSNMIKCCNYKERKLFFMFCKPLGLFPYMREI